MSKGLTLVIGASENSSRYSNMAVHRLLAHGYPVAALGSRPGKIADTIIQTGHPEFSEVDTITLYVGPERLAFMHDYILSLKPNRVIFNPGTEDEAFFLRLRESGIEAVEACTLVMLSTGQF
ncbi:MAG: CoA-binding protein [Bacteroidota bacterium]